MPTGSHLLCIQSKHRRLPRCPRDSSWSPKTGAEWAHLKHTKGFNPLSVDNLTVVFQQHSWPDFIWLFTAVNWLPLYGNKDPDRASIHGTRLDLISILSYFQFNFMRPINFQTYIPLRPSNVYLYYFVIKSMKVHATVFENISVLINPEQFQNLTISLLSTYFCREFSFK